MTESCEHSLFNGRPGYGGKFRHYCFIIIFYALSKSWEQLGTNRAPHFNILFFLSLLLVENITSTVLMLIYAVCVFRLWRFGAKMVPAKWWRFLQTWLRETCVSCWSTRATVWTTTLGRWWSTTQSSASVSELVPVWPRCTEAYLQQMQHFHYNLNSNPFQCIWYKSRLLWSHFNLLSFCNILSKQAWKSD